MAVELNQPVSQRQFGALVGISQAAVAKHAAQGVLREGGTLGEWLLSYCGKLRAEASGRAGDESLALTRAKTREAESKAQMSELQYHRELGQLVPVEEVEPILEAWAVTARSETQHAVDKVVAAIESRYGIEVAREVSEEPLAAAFAVIAGYPRDLAGDVAAGSSAVAAAGGGADAAVAG